MSELRSEQIEIEVRFVDEVTEIDGDFYHTVYYWVEDYVGMPEGWEFAHPFYVGRYDTAYQVAGPEMLPHAPGAEIRFKTAVVTAWEPDFEDPLPMCYYGSCF